MSNTNEKQQQLVNKLKEIFQLDQPELDFGLYKIMHAKSDQISAFIDNDLTAHIDSVFGEASTEDNQANLQKEKANIIASLGEAAFDEEGKLQESYTQVPIVKPYLDALKASETDGGTLSNSASIYDHLYRFFSRYYDNGDFLSRRYHVAENAKRAAPYAVPYDGREVYLHWANKDQYYIKTSESFNSYTFNLTEAIKKERGSGELELGETSSTKKIHFQLVDADQGEHNNVKVNQARFFIVHTEQPAKLNEQEELVLQFEYRVDPDKKGQNNTWQQNKLKEAEALILETLKSQTAYKDWYADLTTPAPTEKDKSRNILAKYLKQYTARNTMDYFIHKDLGGFLNRELDFYIKNEIMQLDEIEQSDSVSIESWLLKIKVLRQVAKKVISFLAQLEEFQKNLWLKKKFVTETNYFMTLDKLGDESETFYKEILGNQKQIQEWVDLGFIKKDSVITEEYLKDKPYLVIDTGLFDKGFKDQLLSKLNEDLNEITDGVLLHSENFQALNLIQERYREQVKCVYIDPPYNSGSNDFTYKDSYRNSSWLSMLQDRIYLTQALMRKDAVFFSSIDDKDEDNRVAHRLMHLLENQFGAENYLDNLIWVKNTTHNDAKTFSHNHEYILGFSKNRKEAAAKHAMFRQNKPGYIQVMELVHKLQPHYPTIVEVQHRIRQLYKEQTDEYKEGVLKQGLKWDKETKRNDPWKGIKQYKYVEYRLPDDIWVDEKEAKQKGAILRVFRESDPAWPNANTLTSSHKNINDIDYRFYQPIHPETKKKCPPPKSGWRWREKPNPEKPNTLSFEALDKGGLLAYGDDESKIPQFKRFLHNVETDVVKSVITDFTDGEKELANVIGERGTFPNPKPTSVLQKLIEITTNENEIVLDSFVGSGSTAHAFLKQNFADEKKRKFVFTEMADYFDTTLIPRLKKLCFSLDWKDGEPISNEGVSLAVKYNRLESYEDTINNLCIKNQVDTQNLPDEFVINYLLETETAESPSLLNISEFKDPTNYNLSIRKPGSDQRVDQPIDLIETFNWLIGLRVEELDKWRSYEAEFVREKDPELPEDQNTRLIVKSRKERDAYSDEAGDYQLRMIEGWCCRNAGDESVKDKVLIIWRKLTDDLEKDAALLESILTKKKVNQADSEYHLVYINGSHGLQLRGDSKSRLMNLEETFMAKMWEDAV